METEKVKVKRIFKYATGEAIPEGAVYLSTVTQTRILNESDVWAVPTPCWFVWHYFLVEVEEIQHAT